MLAKFAALNFKTIFVPLFKLATPQIQVTAAADSIPTQVELPFKSDIVGLEFIASEAKSTVA